MFGLFRKRIELPPVRDIVWATKPFKWAGCQALMREHNDAILVSWFEQSAEECRSYLLPDKQVSIIPARQLLSPQVAGKTVIFLEHYPVPGREHELIVNWKPKQIIVLNALDEPLFKYFGGDRIATMLERIGQQPGEPIEHLLISKAISSAQEKIEKKLVTEHLASSQEEWFRKNLPTGKDTSH